MKPYVGLDPDLCDLKACQQQCVAVCPVNQKGLNTITIKGGRAVIHDVGCAGCLQCVTACPVKAIWGLQAKPGKEKRAGEARPPIDPRAPYTVDEQVYQRFDERNMVFARVDSDPDFDHYQKGVFHNAPRLIEAGRAGRGRAELALSSASWTVYDNYEQAFSWQELEGVSGKDALAKVKAKDGTKGRAKVHPLQEAETDLSRLTRQVKRTARLAGAGQVGIAPLDLRWVYTHNRHGKPLELPEGVDKAVVLLIEMDQDALASSPAWSSATATGLGYSRIAFVIAIVAEFIRNMGYTAIPCGNDTALSVPLAIDAGLGEAGRHGLLINPRYGSRARICKVFTDMPLETDTPMDLGVRRFCRICKRCAQDCPSHSIPFDDEPVWQGVCKSNNDGVHKWYVNVESCYRFWVANGNECSNCVRACPFTKEEGASHAMVRWFIRHIPSLNRVWLAGDRLMGYGRQSSPESFWDSKRRVRLK